ncbi:hypothetical protein BC831DRAFT_474839 [Entophlyctis helioformis]|nr:hypothetical protein BC831DRAFT_474839 [Entophlyctis helioformis]
MQRLCAGQVQVQVQSVSVSVQPHGVVAPLVVAAVSVGRRWSPLVVAEARVDKSVSMWTSPWRKGRPAGPQNKSSGHGGDWMAADGGGCSRGGGSLWSQGLRQTMAMATSDGSAVPSTSSLTIQACDGVRWPAMACDGWLVAGWWLVVGQRRRLAGDGSAHQPIKPSAETESAAAAAQPSPSALPADTHPQSMQARQSSNDGRASSHPRRCRSVAGSTVLLSPTALPLSTSPNSAQCFHVSRAKPE